MENILTNLNLKFYFMAKNDQIIPANKIFKPCEQINPPSPPSGQN